MLNARRSCCGADKIAKQGQPLRRIGGSVLKVQIDDRYLVRVETCGDLREVCEGSDEKSGTNQEHDGKRNLSNDEAAR